MEPLALQWGVPVDVYWDLTFLEIIAQVEANKMRYELEMKNRAMFDYNAAQLQAFAVHQPNKMPKSYEMYPFLKEEVEQKPIYEQEYDAEADKAILMQQIQGIKQHLRKVGEEDGTGKIGDNH